ncbi:MAG: DUF971 domain-containing protein [Rhodocyclaceae bacterium]|nr:DUF971 domain-containing protein [Rhodocyclaceae bacterium]MBX3668130.1 DUF971 domain-containing protein [Rhodocyclaceae bacterium]
MAGLSKNTPIPTEIRVHQKSRFMELSFDDGSHFKLSFEFLRVFSPSAEVRGHGPGQETLQTGKRNVDVTRLEPVGNYAVKPVFSDGHESGIYSWDYLYTIGAHQDELWQDYLRRLEEAGADRDQPMNAPVSGGHSCGKH